MSHGQEQRRAFRENYEHWVDLRLVDETGERYGNRYRTPTRDVSELGLGVFVADPVEAGDLLVVRLRRSMRDPGPVRFGRVQHITRLGQWFLLGVEFVEAPAWAGDGEEAFGESEAA